MQGRLTPKAELFVVSLLPFSCDKTSSHEHITGNYFYRFNGLTELNDGHKHHGLLIFCPLVPVENHVDEGGMCQGSRTCFMPYFSCSDVREDAPTSNLRERVSYKMRMLQYSSRVEQSCQMLSEQYLWYYYDQKGSPPIFMALMDFFIVRKNSSHAENAGSVTSSVTANSSPANSTARRYAALSSEPTPPRRDWRDARRGTRDIGYQPGTLP